MRQSELHYHYYQSDCVHIYIMCASQEILKVLINVLDNTECFSVFTDYHVKINFDREL